MDISRIQSAAASLGNNGVDHLTNQPGSPDAGVAQRELIQAVKAVNGGELFGRDSELTFVFDRQTRKALVRIVDKRTGEVMLQLPPERVLQMAQEQKGK